MQNEFQLEIFIPYSVDWEQAFQLTKHFLNASKSGLLTNPNRERTQIEKEIDLWENGYIWHFYFRI